MKPYFHYKGICELAKKLNGNERIYLGIRPYGFHAGNATTMVIYPLLLCREIEKLGKMPHFTFYVFLNDWEQDSLDGPDPKLYPFNVMPKFTTWQYVKDPVDEKLGIVDFWERVIVNNVNLVKHYFPNVNVISSRNSEMKYYPEMKDCIYKTINNPELILNILKKYTNKEILDMPTFYASAVCPYCHAARGITSGVKEQNSIFHKCNFCGKNSDGKYEDFDYWLYHKPLALPRIAAFNIDLCITGLDHYDEGDFTVRQKLIEAYGLNSSRHPNPKTLYASSIYGIDGNLMGKSKGNAKLIDMDKLINLIISEKDSKKIVIPDKI
jgi:hypothetical protein